MVEPVEIIVISLVRSTERRAQAARQLDATGLPWSFLDAVDGSKLTSFPPEYDEQLHIRYYGRRIPVGHIGCFMSHRQAWEKCVQTNRLTMIFEDDFQILQDLPTVIALARQHVASFDVLKIQGLKNDCPYRVVKTVAGGKLVQHHRDPLGATGYIVKPSAAKVLLEKSRRFHAPVDDFIFHDWIHGLEIVSLLPYPVDTDYFKADYQSNINGQHLEPLSRKAKFLVRLHRLPRSAKKRFYYSRKALARWWRKLLPARDAN